jgi:hypothetical protein
MGLTILTRPFFTSTLESSNPLRVTGWVAGLHAYLDSYNVLFPTAWLESLPHEELVTDAAAGATEFSLSAERTALQQLLLDLAGESRRPRTLANLRHPALKALWWLASRRRHLPPTSEDIAEYLAFLSRDVDTIGSISDARGAIGFLARVNAGSGLNKDGILGGRATIPLEAMRRRHAHAVDKAPGLPTAYVLAIMRAYGHFREDLPLELQWCLAVAASIAGGFKLMARYADLRHVVYDDDFFIVHDLFIRIYVSERKTHVYGGQWIDVARSPDGSFCVYDVLLLGKRVFRRGCIMPHID